MKFLSLSLILASLAGAVFGVMRYPLNPFWLGFALVVYAFVLWVKPKSWLFMIPAILPIADLAPWSGWLFFEELDLFVLVTVAVGYWKLMQQKPVFRLSPVAAMLLILLSLSYGVSAYVSLMPLQKLDANAFSNYLSHYNSLRILKPFLWGLLLLPLLRRSLDGFEVERLFVPGLLTGLALVSMASFWERMTFTGLMDFSSEYRITSTFPEMHTGGAALDAFLALTLPFSLFWIFRGKRLFSSIAAIVLLATGTYATLVTFSRGLYLAFGVSMVVMLSAMAIGSQRSHSSGSFRVVPVAIVLAVAVAILVNVFATGGYRGLFVAVVLLWAAFFMGGLPEPLPLKVGIAALLVFFGSFSFILLDVFTKGAYLSFSLAFFIFIIGFLAYTFGGSAMAGIGAMFAATGFLAMSASGLMVDRHWGGGPALTSGVIVTALALALAVVNTRVKNKLWRWERSSVLLLSMFLMVMSFTIPVIGNYYMEQRLSQGQTDWHVRTDHWIKVLSMMDKNAETYAFGMGLGKFPEIYYWKGGNRPGTHRLETEGEGAYLRLSGSEAVWAGNYLSYGQRVDIRPSRTYVLELDVRSAFPKERLIYRICEKLLLYGKKCIGNTLFLEPDGKWHHYTVQLNSGSIDSEPWYERPPAQFYLASASESGFLDLKNVSLTDGNGNIIHNGDFRHGADRWFFSSDYFHLPWHEQNLMLHIYFEQGIIGLAAFCLLVLYAILRQAVKARYGDLLAAAFVASFSGFLIIGIFDSVLDLNRIALLFYLLLFLSLLRPKIHTPVPA